MTFEDAYNLGVKKNNPDFTIYSVHNPWGAQGNTLGGYVLRGFTGKNIDYNNYWEFRQVLTGEGFAYQERYRRESEEPQTGEI